MPSQSVARRLVSCLLLLSLQLPGWGCAERAGPASAPPAGSQHTQPLLWLLEARSGARLYMLGSVHVGPRVGWRHPSHVERAFEDSRTLIVELDTRAVATDAQEALILHYGLLGPDESLREQLTPETWALLERHVAGSELRLEALERMRPWLVSNVLVNHTATRIGLSPSTGVDRDFLARAGTRRVLALETAESQLRSMAELPESVQEIALRDLLGHAGEIEGYLETMIEAWRIGDERKLVEIVFEGLYDHPEYAPFFEALIFERNRQMAERLAELLERGELRAGFLVVGVAHLVGEQSIVELLARQGHRVRRVPVRSFAGGGGELAIDR